MAFEGNTINMLKESHICMLYSKEDDSNNMEIPLFRLLIASHSTKYRITGELHWLEVVE